MAGNRSSLVWAVPGVGAARSTAINGQNCRVHFMCFSQGRLRIGMMRVDLLRVRSDISFAVERRKAGKDIDLQIGFAMDEVETAALGHRPACLFLVHMKVFKSGSSRSER
jgi:hypothetical protein